MVDLTIPIFLCKHMLVKGFSHIHPLTNSCRCSQLSVHITQMESQFPTSCSKACPWRKDSKARGLRVPFLLIPLNALSIWNLGLPLTSDNVSNGSLLLYNYIYLVAVMSTVPIRIGCLFIWYKCCRWDPITCTRMVAKRHVCGKKSMISQDSAG